MKKNNKTLVIAEIGVNHNGQLSTAKKLIKKAVEAGADIVKFQIFKSERLVTLYAKKAKYQLKNNIEKQTQFEMLKKLEFGFKEFFKILKFSKKLKIEFCASCFDIESLELFKKLNIKKIKIPSSEITNYFLLKKIAKLKKQIIMSTGMSTLSEIKNAVNTLISYGAKRKNITLLQCNSEYPTPYKDANLLVINELKKKFNLRVGYSDHTDGIEASIAAVALGASVIEKHLTLNKSLSGPDHKASLEPNEFKKLVSSIRNVEIALGTGNKVVTKSENKNIAVVRKSIVASKTIFRGEKFSIENLDAKRSGKGLSPMLLGKIIGIKANKDYKIDEIIKI